MYRSNSDYQHRPYKKQFRGADIFYACARWYIVIFTIAYTTVWFTSQQVFQFKNLNIVGVHSADRVEIEKIVHNSMNSKRLFFWYMNNLALYPKRSVEDEIKKYDSRISSVAISLDRQNIDVEIKEFEPSMRYCIPALSRVDSNVLPLDENLNNSTSSASSTTQDIEQNINLPVPSEGETNPGLNPLALDGEVDTTTYDCYWADENSYIFAKSPTYSGLPIFTITENDSAKSKTLFQEASPIGKNIFTKEKFANLQSIINLLQYSGLYVKEAKSLPNDDIILELGYPWSVVMNTKRNPEDSVDNLLLALKELKVTATSTESRIKQIDTRFGNKVFYK